MSHHVSVLARFLPLRSEVAPEPRALNRVSSEGDLEMGALTKRLLGCFLSELFVVFRHLFVLLGLVLVLLRFGEVMRLRFGGVLSGFFLLFFGLLGMLLSFLGVYCLRGRSVGRGDRTGEREREYGCVFHKSPYGVTLDAETFPPGKLCLSPHSGAYDPQHSAGSRAWNGLRLERRGPLSPHAIGVVNSSVSEECLEVGFL